MHTENIMSLNHQSYIDFKAISDAQKLCADEISTYSASATGLELREIDYHNGTILCDISTGIQRPVIPSTWKKTVFDTYH